MAELKPCKYCAENPKVMVLYGCTKVYCQNLKCKVRPSTNYYNSPLKAFEAWNRRANDG